MWTRLDRKERGPGFLHGTMHRLDRKERGPGFQQEPDA